MIPGCSLCWYWCKTLVGTVASAPLVPGMKSRGSVKKNTFLIGALLGTCGYLLFFWVSVWSLPVALVALAIASIGQGVTMATVMWALEADTVEYGEYLTGVRVKGSPIHYSHLPVKCGQAIGGSIPAFIFGIKRIYHRQSGANAGSYYGHPHINCLSTLRIYATGIRHYLVLSAHG